MEFREIIIVFGLVAILVILWDGFRRMKLKPKKPKARVEPDDDWVDPDEAAKKAQIARELPNGGARTREMTDEEKQEISNKFKLNLRERVPMLMERVVVEGEESDAERLEQEAQLTEDQQEQASAIQSEIDFSLETSRSEEPLPTTAESLPDAADDGHPIEEMVCNEDSDLSFSATQEDPLMEQEAEAEIGIEADLQDVGSDSEPFESEAPEDAVMISDSSERESAQETEAESPMPVEDLIVVHVMAKSGEEINGQALLELLVHSGLRHGPMDIFHYRNPKGKTEFSLANCVQPGTFNPDAMADVNTPGVTLFLQLPCTADAMESFEHMIEMARFMAKHLNAELLDEDHNGVTPQVVEYYREKLRAFARKQLIPS